MELDKMKTGDILLFTTKLTFNPISWLGCLIQKFTNTRYSHVGMIVKDPTWANPDLKGLYLWESSFNGTPDPQDNKVKLGVQLTPLEMILKRTNHDIYYRAIKDNHYFTESTLQAIHKDVYDKPYDVTPIDWFDAYIKTPLVGRKTNTFFCSALVGYIYSKAGLLVPDVDWSLLWPSDFSVEKERLEWKDECLLSNVEVKID